MEIDPEGIGATDRYKLLSGCITPRPIAFVSTAGPDGRPNLAPFSFFAGAGADPMAVCFCPLNDAEGREKDTLRNAAPTSEGGTGEFVVNLAVEAYLRQVALAAERLPYGESEFDLTGLTPAPARAVTPPRVGESPAGFECRTLRVERLAPGVPMSGNIVIGRVVWAWVRDDLVDDRLHVDQERLQTVGRMGGTRYARTREQLSLPRGRAAIEAADPFADDPTSSEK